ncbi:MAG TPA: peptide deformylase [Patescibacteria group bacterium]|nr:peptide deformylase [Patescibacteria group bacterium]
MATTKDDIITLPNPHLRQHSTKVKLVNKDIVKLVHNMTSAVKDWDKSRPHEVTVALAAVQVDELHRVIIVRDDFDHDKSASYSALINPEITKLEGPIKADYEGCLSIKSVYGMVPRHTKVRVKALDLDGKPFRVKAEGFLARVLQHEIDHLNGKLFIDRIKTKHKAFYQLTDKGELEQLDYEKYVQDNNILW